MDFKINRGQGKCSVTGRAFEDGETYVVALRPDPEAGEDEAIFRRLEISDEAWQDQNAEDYTAWWPTEYSTRRKPALFDPDALWEVFHKARRKQDEPPPPAQDDEPTTGNVEEFSRDDLDRFAYVAALGLMRLKKLRLQGTKRRGKREYLVFETKGRKKDRQSYQVPNPELDEQGVEQIQDRLADLA